MDILTVSRADQSREGTRTSFNVAEITAANFDAQAGLATSLVDALGDIVLAGAHRVAIAHVYESGAKAYAGDREAKWLITVEDTTNHKLFSYELGTADPAAPVINQGGKTLLDPTSLKFSALGSALSNYILSPYGNGVTLQTVEKVGRNL